MSLCDDLYRNGGPMREPEEPRVYDTVDWFNRARRDPRMVGNQLREMRCLTEDVYEEQDNNETH